MGVPSYISSATGVNTLTLPAHQAGDIILGCAFRDGSNTAPSIPSGVGWSAAIKSGGANTCSMVLVAKRAAGSSESFGTFTNATSCIGVVVRGARAVGFIGASAEDGASSNTPNFPALSPMSVTDGSSLVFGFIGHRAVDGTITNVPSGMTNRNSVTDATDQMAVHDTNGGVSSWGNTTASLGGTASGYRTITVELLAPFVCNLPTGALVDIDGVAPSIRVKESSALPSGAVVDIDGVAPTFTLTSASGHVSNLPSGALVDIDGVAPSIRVKESSALPSGALIAIAAESGLSFRLTSSTALPAGAVLDIAGAAPSFALTQHVSSELPAGAVVEIQAEAPSFELTLHLSSALPSGAALALQGNASSLRLTTSSALPAGAVVEIEAAAPSFLLSSDAFESLLPSGAELEIIGEALSAQLTDIEPTVREPVPAGAFSGVYDAILWPPQWSKPQLTLCLLPEGKLEILGRAPAVVLTQNSFSRMPEARAELRAAPVQFELSRHLRAELPTLELSTRGHAPVILMSDDGISESEVLCLMLL